MLNRNGKRAVLEMNLIARRNLQFQLKRASVLGDTFHGSGQALEHDRSIQIVSFQRTLYCPGKNEVLKLMTPTPMPPTSMNPFRQRNKKTKESHDLIHPHQLIESTSFPLISAPPHHIHQPPLVLSPHPSQLDIP